MNLEELWMWILEVLWAVKSEYYVAIFASFIGGMFTLFGSYLAARRSEAHSLVMHFRLKKAAQCNDALTVLTQLLDVCDWLFTVDGYFKKAYAKAKEQGMTLAHPSAFVLPFAQSSRVHEPILSENLIFLLESDGKSDLITGIRLAEKRSIALSDALTSYRTDRERFLEFAERNAEFDTKEAQGTKNESRSGMAFGGNAGQIAKARSMALDHILVNIQQFLADLIAAKAVTEKYHKACVSEFGETFARTELKWEKYQCSN